MSDSEETPSRWFGLEPVDLRTVLEGLNTSGARQDEPDATDEDKVGKQGDGDVSSDADDTLDYIKKRRAAEITRLEEDNKQRKWFFRFVLAVTAVPVIVASLAMIAYVFGEGNSEAVYIGYFTSVVVEVIGLSIVIANYLFPRNGSIQKGTEKSEE